MKRMIRAAWVIARRDYVATVFSRTFLLFLIGPLMPILFAVLFGAIATHSIAVIAPVIVLVVISFVLLGLVQSTLQGIYAAALYRYAEAGEVGGGFDQALLESAFRVKA